MKLWRVIPLFALAQASCYDYEYYDPDTGSSIPGNACAKQQATAAAGTSIGQPLTSTSATTFGAAPAATSYAPVATFSSAPATTAYPSASFASSAYPSASFASGTVPAYSGTLASSFAAPVAAPVYGATTVAATYPLTSAAVTYPVATTVASAPVYSTTTIAAGYPVAATAVAPAAVTIASTNRAASSGVSSQQKQELQYYQNLAQRQSQQHQQNARIVQQASQDLSRASLINTFASGSSFYPLVRLRDQKNAADAYKSEKRIAEKNADDAYQRYQQDPSRLNLLVSKYQDLNADLRGAAYQYNVVNSGTFGQSLARTSLFGVSGNFFNTITQVVTQKKQSSDLQDIQRKMQRVQRQIVSTVQAQQQQSKSSASSTAAVVAPAGSVQQRMMALSVYGPQQG